MSKILTILRNRKVPARNPPPPPLLQHPVDAHPRIKLPPGYVYIKCSENAAETDTQKWHHSNRNQKLH